MRKVFATILPLLAMVMACSPLSAETNECGNAKLCPQDNCEGGLPKAIGISCCNDLAGVRPAFAPADTGEEEKSLRPCGVEFSNGLRTGLNCGPQSIVPGEDACGTVPGE